MKWKIYFWIYAALTVFGTVLLIPSFQSLNFGSYEGIIESIILVIGLYAYVYAKKIGSQNLWKGFFWFILLYWILQILVLIIPISSFNFITPNIQGGANLVMVLTTMVLTTPALVSVYRLGNNEFLLKNNIKIKTSNKMKDGGKIFDN